jgi:ribosome-associated protein
VIFKTGFFVNKLEFQLRGEHIALDALLKATGFANSGGMAKIMITEGQVWVDDQPELRRACKLRVGQVVKVNSTQIQILAGSSV